MMLHEIFINSLYLLGITITVSLTIIVIYAVIKSLEDNK
jgi:hypothetical protein